MSIKGASFAKSGSLEFKLDAQTYSLPPRARLGALYLCGCRRAQPHVGQEGWGGMGWVE